MTDYTAAEQALRPTPDQAFDAWSTLVAANREQIERLRESRPDTDFYRPRARQFRPGRREEAADLGWVLEHARPGDSWLDIGAGGGRIAIPAAEQVASVHAVEPSEAMREVMAAAAEAAGLDNLHVHDLRWPPAGADLPVADVSVASHVLYDQDDLRGFLGAMEAHTRRTCIVVIGDRAPSGAFEPVWSELYGEPVRLLPARRELLAALGALDRPFEVRTLARRAPDPVDREDAHRWAQSLYWVQPDSDRHQRATALIEEHFATSDGRIVLPGRNNYVSVISWPGGAA